MELLRDDYWNSKFEYGLLWNENPYMVQFAVPKIELGPAFVTVGLLFDYF